MSQLATNRTHSAPSTHRFSVDWQMDPPPTPEPRWSLIMRARRDIQAGAFDDPASLQAKLDQCIDSLLEDIEAVG